MTYKCIIVDDEPHAHEVLKAFISKLEDFELIDTALNAIEASKLIREKKIDVMFLDINMPEISGLELISTLQNPPKIILTTAYSEFALNAFDLGAIDYLVKPIPFVRFLKAIDKLRNTSLVIPEATFQPYLELRIDGISKKFQTSDILFFQSYGNYIKVHTEKKTFLTILSMIELEKHLNPSQFVRVHKSFIVPTESIKENLIQDKIVIGATEIPIGRSYRALLKKQFSK
jgi:DNA-binding LytR/AlgR family response regulator